MKYMLATSPTEFMPFHIMMNQLAPVSISKTVNAASHRVVVQAQTNQVQIESTVSTVILFSNQTLKAGWCFLSSRG